MLAEAFKEVRGSQQIIWTRTAPSGRALDPEHISVVTYVTKRFDL